MKLKMLMIIFLTLPSKLFSLGTDSTRNSKFGQSVFIDVLSSSNGLSINYAIKYSMNNKNTFLFSAGLMTLPINAEKLNGQRNLFRPYWDTNAGLNYLFGKNLKFGIGIGAMYNYGWRYNPCVKISKSDFSSSVNLFIKGIIQYNIFKGKYFVLLSYCSFKRVIEFNINPSNYNGCNDSDWINDGHDGNNLPGLGFGINF